MDGIEPGHLDRGVDGRRAAEARAVLVGVGSVGRLAAADAVDVGEAADRPAVVGERSLRRVDQLLELGQRDDAVDAVAELADRRLVGVEAGRDDDRTDRDLDRAGSRVADPDAHPVVAEAAGLGDDLGSGQHRDRRPSLDLGDERRDQLPAVLLVREHRAEAADPATELELPLDDRDAQADVGQSDRRPQPGDPAADHQRVGQRLDDHRDQRRREPCPVDAGADERGRLVGRGRLVVGMHPRALLADVDLRVLVRVEPGAGRHAPERVGVELGRARGHDEPVELLLLDVMGHVLLGGVRAGEHGRLRDDDIAGVADVRDHAFDIDVVGDVAAAVADVDTDAACAWVPVSMSVPGSVGIGCSVMPAPSRSRVPTSHARGGPRPGRPPRRRGGSSRRCPWRRRRRRPRIPRGCWSGPG